MNEDRRQRADRPHAASRSVARGGSAIGGGAPQFLAAMRNAAMTLLRAIGIGNIAEALRENAWNTQRLLAILGNQ